MFDPKLHKLDQINDDSNWDLIEQKITDQCSCALLYCVVLAFDIWHMLIFYGGVKVCFLRE